METGRPRRLGYVAIHSEFAKETQSRKAMETSANGNAHPAGVSVPKGLRAERQWRRSKCLSVIAVRVPKE